MATLDSIQMKIKRLQTQAVALAEKQTTATLDRIRDLMNQHGLTVADVEGHLKGQKRRALTTDKHVANGKAKPVTGKAKLPAKYMNPKTGETWSGWARPPAWIKNVKDRSKFLIENGAAISVSLAKAEVKKSAGTHATAQTGRRKGPQPAKYRNPKTGATWSGRGPAPAWLAGAKDRTKFLIDPASNVDAKESGTKGGAGKSMKAKANGARGTKASAGSPAIRKTAVARKAAKPTAKTRAIKKVAGRKSMIVKKAVPSTSKPQASESASAN